jgi:hypothetical protein
MTDSKGSTVNRNIILLGYEATKTSEVSKQLADLGIYMLKASPSDVQVLCYRSEIQPGYDIYVRNLPKFIEANVRAIEVPLNPPFFSILSVCKSPIYSTWPPLAVTFGVPLGDKESTFAEFGLSKNKVRNVTQYIFQKPSVELIKSFTPLKPDRTCQVPHGTVNLEALNRYFQVSCLLGAVIAVQNYPAFDVEDLVTFAKQPSIQATTNVSTNMTDVESEDEINRPRKRFAEV